LEFYFMTVIAKRKLESGVNQLGPLTRYVRLMADAGGAETEVPVGIVDIETRTVTFSFSSEAAVDMWYGTEILSHQAGSANLARINSGGPLLYNHDLDDILGVVEKAWIGADKRGYCTVRFGKDERGEWAMMQVNDRILQNVSFMYRVYTYTTDVDSDIYTATSWEVYEITLCTVPADVSVGVGRGAANNLMDVLVTRSASNPAPVAEQPKGITMTVITEPPVDKAALEASRVAEIDAMCKAHKIPDEVRNSMITLHAPIDAARGYVLDIVMARSNGAVSLGNNTNPDLTEREKARYSMIRAINASFNERTNVKDAWGDAGFEREVSLAIEKASGKRTAGFYMPTNIQFASGRAADYSIGTGAGLSATSGGANLVSTQLMAENFIELLRNKSLALSMGARMLSGLVGNVTIPRQKAAGSVFWVSENGVVPQSGGGFDSISLTKKTMGMLSVITRDMLMQATPDVEMLVRQDMLRTAALGIDAAVLYGSGAGGQPLGIANQTGIGSVVGGANGSLISIDDFIDLETLVTTANADGSSLGYLTNAAVIGALKKLKTTTGAYLWTNSPVGQRDGTPGEINAYPVGRTNQARSNLSKGTAIGLLSEIFFGDWEQVLVGEWGAMEILPNPYIAGVYEAGAIELRLLQSIDVAVRHPEAFAVKSDALVR
jgi:HK97 family phage major capsid protein/HK97 family phage prohead protease